MLLRRWLNRQVMRLDHGSLFFWRLRHRIPQHLKPRAQILLCLDIGSDLFIGLNIRIDDAISGLTLFDQAEAPPSFLLDIVLGFVFIDLF